MSTEDSDRPKHAAHSCYMWRLIYRDIKAILLASAVLSCALASDSLAQDPKTKTLGENVLATLQFPEGIVQFGEPVQGLLVVTIQAQAISNGRPTVAIGGVPTEALDGLDPLGQYEKLSGGAAAPPALVQAQERLSTMGRNAAPGGTAVVDDRQGVPARAKSRRPGAPSLEGSDFEKTRCPRSGYDFYFCWLYRTGTSYVQRASASNLQSVVNPYSGNVQQHVEYYGGGYWHTINAQTVLEGQIGWMSIYGGSSSKRATIDQAEGNGYHVAFYGRN